MQRCKNAKMQKCKDAKNGVTHLTYILASLHI